MKGIHYTSYIAQDGYKINHKWTIQKTQEGNKQARTQIQQSYNLQRMTKKLKMMRNTLITIVCP